MGRNRLSVYVIKDGNYKNNEPFRHRDGTWYIKQASGAWMKLFVHGNDLLNKRGEVMGHIREPRKTRVAV